jgi:RecJ-like exonuclease
MGAFGMEKCKLCGEWRFAYELNQMYECFYCLIESGELKGWPCPDCEGGSITKDKCSTCKGEGTVAHRSNSEDS